MSMNIVRVKTKAAPKRRVARSVVIAVLSLVVMSAIAMAAGYDWQTGRLGVIGPQPVVEELQTGGRVIKVPSGGNVQAALERAESGDVVELEAGGVYVGQINLPLRPHTDFVTIRSSAADRLPEGKRVSPADRVHMATITSGMLGRAAVMAEKGAHHYRFVGIEFTSAGSVFNYGLVVLGNGEKRPENVPHTIEIDRSYFHPHKPGRSRRGVALNSADTVIKNSYIEGFAVEGEDGQGICGWSGTRNAVIENNYIEGGGAGILFGGADPDNAEMIPTGIEITRNVMEKPREWIGKYTIKTAFQLKNSRRVRFTGNLIKNNWVGSAFRFTVRNQDGKAPFSTIEDTVISDNVIDGAGEGINILGRDDTHPSQTLKRLTIKNNLLFNLGGSDYEGSGYFTQISGGEDIDIHNNTSINPGNIVTIHGDLPVRFRFFDNITGHGNYGIHGPINMRSDAAKAMFYGNVFFNINNVDPSGFSFPDGNEITETVRDVGFADFGNRNFMLTNKSKYRGKGSILEVMPWIR
jgi:hypothetical protein